VSWALPFITQLTKFPVAEHDEYVDTFSQAIIYFKNEGWFTLQQARDIDEPRKANKVVSNPYSA
jgi:hypothetical protein